MDKYDTVAQAMSISGDTITRIGSNEEVLKNNNDNAEIVDLHGKTVIPGLIDSHTHILWAATSELNGELFIPQSIEELLDYVRERTKELPEGQWIHLRNTYPTRLKEYRYPTIEELDKVSPRHPVFVDGAYAGRANSYALKKAGICKNTPASAMIPAIKRCLKERPMSIQEYKQGIKNIQTEYNRLGITSVIDGISDLVGVQAINELYDEGQLNVRIVFSKVVSQAKGACDDMKTFKSHISLPHKWGKLSFLKVMIDGGILTGTSYMRRPYNDKIGIFDMPEGFRGIINHDVKELIEFIDVAYNEGYQMSAHSIGDGALDVLLSAYMEYGRKRDMTDRRFSIIHGDFTDDLTLNTIKALNLILLFQPAWHFKDANILSKLLDHETMESFLPYAKYVDKGIYAAAGSDHMVKYHPLLSQNPYHPFWALYNMITRNTIDGRVIGGEQSIDRKEALKFYTWYGAYASFDEDKKGSLETGKLADFAILSKDYFTCPVDDIPKIKSLFTVVGGNIVIDTIKCI